MENIKAPELLHLLPFTRKQMIVECSGRSSGSFSAEHLPDDVANTFHQQWYEDSAGE